MSESKIRWEPYGSMHFGYLGDAEHHNFDYIIQGPTKGMYSLYTSTSAGTLRIEEFENLEAAKLAAERMEVVSLRHRRWRKVENGGE